MVGVTGQVQQVASSVVQRVKQEMVRNQTGTESRNRIQGQEKHNTKAESVGLAIP
ncbi:unnamed protein product [Staurois parvus]|uniref:Uncharacterized protein n=1 Tax=Staurois parvus TaxID=386267 RepID=A0ABN9BCX2_9NEOB|nr:unnamed protein product [Staurois parvus]